MGQELKFFITDVFGEKKYSGNQLATFINCENLSDDEMLQIAREINFSETTFILSDENENGGYDVRIFTPGEEVDFAGHPALGTAYIIQKHIIKAPVEKVVLNLKVGQIPVAFPSDQNSENILWMQQVQPIFKDTIDISFMARLLGLNEDDIDSRYPIEPVSTGLPFNIVPLKDMDALKRAKFQINYLQAFIDACWAKGILIFSQGGYNTQQSLGVRVFVDYYGIPEDPATGSGNGCLAAYLVKHRYFQKLEVDIKTGQGYEIGRPSCLSLKAKEIDDKIEIHVGGKVIPIAEGFWG